MTSGNVAHAESAGVDRAKIDAYVTGYMKKAGYPGVSIAITKGDKVLLTTGYGHDSTGAPMTARTAMPVASVSKSFTALAVMQLVEAGRVDLDAPVRTYLPGFRTADSRESAITVRELLSQTSGITDGTLREKSLPQPRSLAGAEVRARDATLAADPGAEYHYTNTNYHLAARLVEAVAGQPFADYLTAHVLEPLGMRSSSSISRTPDDLPASVEKGHIYLYGKSIAAKEPTRFVSGSDGLITTADDMARWLMMQSSNGRTTVGDPLVTSASIKAMHSTQARGSSYGLGWSKDQKGRWGHSGVWFTYTSYQMLLPSGHGIAVMSNSGLGPGNESPYPLADGLATIIGGGQPHQIGDTRLRIDLVLGGLTLLSIVLGIRTIRRARSWAQKVSGSPMWKRALRLVPRFVPLILLLELPRMVTGLYHRDITFDELFYYSPALAIWAAVASVLGLIVVGARVRAMRRLQRVAI
jgi:CubicO group peptidase (beta-lactamase class C family)